MRVSALVLSVILAAAASSVRADDPAYPHVSDRSFVDASGSKVLRLSTVVDAPAAKAWRAFSTAEGWKLWGVPAAWGEFRTGGVIETAYAPGAQPGQAGNIHNQIVAYTLERLLVLRNVKAPAGFPHAAEFGRTLTVVALEPIDAGHTRIEISGLGFERGSAPYEALYEAFRAGNSYSLEKLKAGIEALP